MRIFSVHSYVVAKPVLEKRVLLSHNLQLLLQGKSIEFFLLQQMILDLFVLELTRKLVDNAGRLKRKRCERLRIVGTHDLFLKFVDDILQFVDLPVFFIDGFVHLIACYFLLGYKS